MFPWPLLQAEGLRVVLTCVWGGWDQPLPARYGPKSSPKSPASCRNVSCVHVIGRVFILTSAELKRCGSSSESVVVLP